MNDNTGKPSKNPEKGKTNNFTKQSLELVLDKDKKKSCAASLKITVVMRILKALLENGRVKRTNLAGKTGLNYSNCIKYVNLLQLLGWLEVSYNDNHFVAITEKGIEIFERFPNL